MFQFKRAVTKNLQLDPALRLVESPPPYRPNPLSLRLFESPTKPRTVYGRLRVTPAEARRHVAEFERQFPEIQKFWKSL